MALSLPNGAVVLVGDGHKALFLRNEGGTARPDLQVTRLLEAPPNPRTHDQGVDRPGRTRTAGRRSAMETTDWHVLAKERFAQEIAHALETARRQQPFETLVVVAPARTLAALREAFSAPLRAITKAELAQDLTKSTVADIIRHVTGNT